jgi:hypothetical protein
LSVFSSCRSSQIACSARKASSAASTTSPRASQRRRGLAGDGSGAAIPRTVPARRRRGKGARRCGRRQASLPWPAGKPAPSPLAGTCHCRGDRAALDSRQP